MLFKNLNLYVIGDVFWSEYNVINPLYTLWLFQIVLRYVWPLVKYLEWTSIDNECNSFRDFDRNLSKYCQILAFVQLCSDQNFW